MGTQHQHNHQEGPAEDVLPAPAQEVQPASAAVDSVLLCSHRVCSLDNAPSLVWLRSATKLDRNRLKRTVRSAGKIIGANLPTIQDLYTSRVRKRAGKITADPSHPGHKLFKLLRP